MDKQILEIDPHFERDRERIFLLTGERFEDVINNYTLPELFRLQRAMLIFDLI